MGDNRELFWRFVAERQAVHHRRFVEGLPFPWTDDPIIRGNHFTNVYREQDRGTVWLRANLHDGGPGPAETLKRVVTYRLINRIGTFEAWRAEAGSPWPVFSYAAAGGLIDFENFLADRKFGGEPVFTGRHLNIGLDGLKDAIYDVCAITDRDAAALRESTDGEAAVRRLRSIKGVGRFFAFQIYEDLQEDGWFPNHADWAYLGPGAIEGMDVIFGHGGWRYEDFEDLRDEADGAFSSLQLDFPYMTDAQGRAVRLRCKDIEHSLCEFSKYYRMLNGGKTSGKRAWPTG